MKNIRVEYAVEATVKTGDFQNVKPGFRVGADVDEGENPTEVKSKLVKILDAWLDEEVQKIGDGTK